MADKNEVYVLGGYQTDFARNWTKENKHFSALMREGVLGALEACEIAPEEIESAHVGNFAAELYCMQGHLGAFFTEVHPAFSGLPTGRHEAACASGSIALLAAGAEIEAGRYDLQAVVGIEQMKTVSASEGGAYLGTAAWYDQEAKDIEFPFPKLFGRLGDEYDKRYGLKDEHLAEISKINYANAKLNPNAQTRTWYMNKEHALCRTEDNPAVGGRIRIADCSQVTDGAVCVFLASREYAERWEFNAGAYRVLVLALGNLQAAKIFGALMVVAIALDAARQRWALDRTLLWTIGAALLLSPTVHPWYVLWVLPFAALRRSRAWIALTGLVFLSYWGLGAYRDAGVWQQPDWIPWAIYGPVLLLVLHDLLRSPRAQRLAGGGDMAGGEDESEWSQPSTGQ